MTDYRRENQQLWNEWSDQFQSYWNANTADGELPPTPSPFGPDAPGGRQPDILDTVEGTDYVELGCGGGQGAVGTAMLGPETVVGVDFSDAQLRHARQLRDYYDADAQFVNGDVTDVPLADDRFDVASSEWAFQMVERIDDAFREAHRILRSGGVFVVSVPHPLNEILDTETGRIDASYFRTGPREITIDDDYESVMVVFDRTVAELHNALVDAGFEVKRLIEHQRQEVRETDPADSDLPSILWDVPQSVRFWAVAQSATHP